MPKKLKLFLDSSALISGLNSPTGGAGVILSAFVADKFFIYISEQVIEEVRRNIEKKFPLLNERFLSFLLSQPEIVEEPSIGEVREAYKLIKTDDAPILAAAIKAKPDFLVTWDKKHFLQKEVTDNVSFTICTPEDFLQKYWGR